MKNTLNGAWTGSFREGHDAQEAKIMNWVLCFMPVAGLLARNLVLSTISLVLVVAHEHNYMNQCCEWVLTQCFQLCCDHKNHLKCLKKKNRDLYTDCSYWIGLDTNKKENTQHFYSH